MQNRTSLVLLKPIFGAKIKTAPPKKIGCRSCEVHVVIRPEKACKFSILAEKSESNSVKKTFFFLFWRSPVCGLKKRLNFRVFREIPSQFSDKPCDSDSRTRKIRVKVVCSFLTLSKKSPLYQILATRLLKAKDTNEIRGQEPRKQRGSVLQKQKKGLRPKTRKFSTKFMRQKVFYRKFYSVLQYETTLLMTLAQIYQVKK